MLNCVEGPAQLLFTTRNREIAVTADALICELKQMEPELAEALLLKVSRWSHPSRPAAIAKIAERCSYLPHALALAGRMVRNEPDGWALVLQAIEHAEWNIISATFPDYPYRDPLAVFDASVATLPLERERLYDLAVFAPNTQVPEAVLRRLWGLSGMSDLAVRAAVHLLHDRNLIEWNFERGLSINSIQSDWLRARSERLWATT